MRKIPTMLKPLCASLASIPLALSAATPPAAEALPAGIANAWQDTFLSQNQCIKRAEFVMRRAGFSRNFQFVGQSVFGEAGDYAGAIRCIDSKDLVFFMVSGTDNETRGLLLDRLIDNF